MTQCTPLFRPVTFRDFVSKQSIRDCEQSQLVLTYPGCGQRRLVTQNGFILLDQFGFRPDLNRPYSDWTISLVLLERHVWDSEHIAPDPYTFVGWGVNWIDLFKYFNPHRISITELPDAQYISNVWSYRATPAYFVDLKLLELDPRFPPGDHLPHWYLARYKSWLIEAKAALQLYTEAYDYWWSHQ